MDDRRIFSGSEESFLFSDDAKRLVANGRTRICTNLGAQ